MTGDDTNLLECDLQCAFPPFEGVCLLAERISDRTGRLYPEEQDAVARAIDRRRHEYATGRDLARRAMRSLGLPPGPILRGTDRQPLWPEGVNGSITHAEDWAAVCVCTRRAMRSVGIDLEVADRVGDDLHRKLFTAHERDVLTGLESWVPGLCFSAKEAGYKATFPLAGRFIGFQEAEVDLDLAAGRFRLRYVGDHPVNQVMEQGQGYFLRSGPYVLSLVLMPHRD